MCALKKRVISVINSRGFLTRDIARARRYAKSEIRATSLTGRKLLFRFRAALFAYLQVEHYSLLSIGVRNYRFRQVQEKLIHQIYARAMTRFSNDNDA